jgi:hypothetical protein
MASWPPSCRHSPAPALPRAAVSPAAQGLQEQPLAAVAQFKSYLLCGVLAWLLLMLAFAPLLYYCSKHAARRIFPAKERKLSV